MRICAVEPNFRLSMLLLSLLAIKREALAQPTGPGRTAQCTWKRGTENNSSQLSSIRFLFLGGNNFLTFRFISLQRKYIMKPKTLADFCFIFLLFVVSEQEKVSGPAELPCWAKQTQGQWHRTHSQAPSKVIDRHLSFDKSEKKKEKSTSPPTPDDQTLSLLFLFCLLERDGFWRLVFLPTSFCLETWRTLLLLNCHVAHSTRPPPIFTSSDEWEKLSESQNIKQVKYIY